MKILLIILGAFLILIGYRIFTNSKDDTNIDYLTVDRISIGIILIILGMFLIIKILWKIL